MNATEECTPPEERIVGHRQIISEYPNRVTGFSRGTHYTERATTSCTARSSFLIHHTCLNAWYLLAKHMHHDTAVWPKYPPLRRTACIHAAHTMMMRTQPALTLIYNCPVISAMQWEVGVGIRLEWRDCFRCRLFPDRLQGGRHVEGLRQGEYHTCITGQRLD